MASNVWVGTAVCINTREIVYLAKQSWVEGEDKYKIASYGRSSVCGQGIRRCKCRVVNWKYVTVGVDRL